MFCLTPDDLQLQRLPVACLEKLNMNIWDFNYKENVKLVSDTGKIYIGTVIDIMDIDENENEEPILSIETPVAIFGLKESEIKYISIIDPKEEYQRIIWELENSLSKIYCRELCYDKTCFFVPDTGSVYYFEVSPSFDGIVMFYAYDLCYADDGLFHEMVTYDISGRSEDEFFQSFSNLIEYLEIDNER